MKILIRDISPEYIEVTKYGDIEKQYIDGPIKIRFSIITPENDCIYLNGEIISNKSLTKDGYTELIEERIKSIFETPQERK